METRAFAPLYGPSDGTSVTGNLTASVTVTSSNSSATASTVLPGSNNNNFYQIHVANKTTAWAHVNFGVLGKLADATVAAGFPVAPISARIVSLNPEVNGASVILDAASTGSNAVVFTRGEGK